MKDYYYILGLEKNATAEFIRDAHRKLSKKFHPDLNPNDPHSEKMFRDIQEAYECLNSEQKKRQYDDAFFNWMNSQLQQTTIPQRQKPNLGKNGLVTIGTIILLATIGFIVPFLLGIREARDGVILNILITLAVPAFLSPFLVAIYNRNRLKWFILAITVVLGWTGVGWIGCLIFSIVSDKE